MIMALLLQQFHTVLSAGLISTKYPLASSCSPFTSFGFAQERHIVLYVEPVTLRSVTLPGGSKEERQ